MVVDGADRLRDGASVTLPNAPPPTAKPSAAPAATAGGDADRAARRAKMQAAMKQYCAADLAKYCPDKTGRDLFMCLRENRDSFSDTCQAALKKMRRSGGGRSGGGGGGP